MGCLLMLKRWGPRGCAGPPLTAAVLPSPPKAAHSMASHTLDTNTHAGGKPQAFCTGPESGLHPQLSTQL